MTYHMFIRPIAVVKNNCRGLNSEQWGDIVSEITMVDDLPESCLEGIDAFSHIEAVFNFHEADSDKIIYGTSFPANNKDWGRVGIFAQRRKDRPNHIGTTIVKLLSRKGRTLYVIGLDALDGTPVLDFKPVVREFLPIEEVKQPDWMTELMRSYW